MCCIFVCVGSGSVITAYDVALKSRLWSKSLFDGHKIHGVRFAKLEDGWLLAVFGGRRLKIFILVGDPSLASNLQCTSSVDAYDHWILDVRFVKYH